MADPISYDVSYAGGEERWSVLCDCCGWMVAGLDREQAAVSAGERHALWHGCWGARG